MRWDYQTTLPASWEICIEATVRTGHGTTDWLQIGKGVHQDSMLSSCLFNLYAEFSSVQFSSVTSNSLQPHESQHAGPPCPSPSPGVHSNSRPSSRWCHPALSSSVVPFPSCPQSPARNQTWVSCIAGKFFATVPHTLLSYCDLVLYVSRMHLQNC